MPPCIALQSLITACKVNTHSTFITELSMHAGTCYGAIDLRRHTPTSVISMCASHIPTARGRQLSRTQYMHTHSLTSRFIPRISMCAANEDVCQNESVWETWDLRRVLIYAINPRGKRCIVYHFFCVVQHYIIIIAVPSHCYILLFLLFSSGASPTCRGTTKKSSPFGSYIRVHLMRHKWQQTKFTIRTPRDRYAGTSSSIVRRMQHQCIFIHRLIHRWYAKTRHTICIKRNYQYCIVLHPKWICMSTLAHTQHTHISSGTRENSVKSRVVSFSLPFSRQVFSLFLASFAFHNSYASKILINTYEMVKNFNCNQQNLNPFACDCTSVSYFHSDDIEPERSREKTFSMGKNVALFFRFVVFYFIHYKRTK